MIPAYIIDRIATSELSGQRVATLLLNMVEAIETLNLPGGTLVLDYAQDGDPIGPGDLVPQIHLVLRRTSPGDIRPPFLPAEAATDMDDMDDDDV